MEKVHPSHAADKLSFNNSLDVISVKPANIVEWNSKR